MVGLVIVSHSKKLAEATVDLIKQVSTVDIPIIAAGGVGPNHEEIGTDTTNILEAIQKVYNSDGVLVLMDMGSAVLSTEMALVFLNDDQVKNVKVCSAPLVEGGMSAAIQVGMGSNLELVMEEAMTSLDAKKSHLQNEDYQEKHIPEQSAELKNNMANCIKKVFTINLVHGLHARPAAKFVQIAAKFKTNIDVTNISHNIGPVNGRSLNRLSSLNVLQGDQILVTASGTEASSAIRAIDALIKENFGESLISTKKPIIKRKRPNGTVGISDGVAIGKAYPIDNIEFTIEKSLCTDSITEQQRLQTAISQVIKNIDQQLENLDSILSEEELEIFEAHRVLLQDPELFDESMRLIKEKKYSAVYAWSLCTKEVKKQYESLGNEYLQMRANDVQDVGDQVLQIITGETKRLVLSSKEPVVIFAKDLTPSETANLDFSIVHGLVTENGGPTSHTAILSRALGIPAVCGFDMKGDITNKDEVIINGFSGEVFINPADDVKTKMKNIREQWVLKKKELLKKSKLPAQTKDGANIQVFANISNSKEAKAAMQAGCEGIGLLRTEFLFLNRKTAPTEEEQYNELVKIGDIMKDKSIVIRTLDIGGDKIIPYISMEHEENPFLGVRGIRLYEKNPEIFTSHIRAVLRAGFDYDFKMMFPMISKGEEFLQTKHMVEKIHKELTKEKIPHKWPIKMGIMIETPSAVIMAKELAKQADFFSMGTNDLTQYVMAAERGNPSLSGYTDPLYPSVLRSIQSTIREAHDMGIDVSVCGEIGSDPLAIPLLIGLDLDKISLNPSKIPEIKEIVRNSNKSMIKKECGKILSLETSKEIRDYLLQLSEESY